LGRNTRAAIASVKGAAVVTAIDIAIAGLSSFFVTAGFLPILGLVLLLESAGLMLLGGALSFSSQPSTRRLTSILTKTKIEVSKPQLEDVEAKAATIALVGVLLFLESLALAAATL
jgi:hypothetical protein